MYNAKIIKYKHGYQIQLYDMPIVTKKEQFEEDFEHNYIDHENGDYDEDTYKMIRDAQRIWNKQQREFEFEDLTEEERFEMEQDAKLHSVYCSLGRTRNSICAIARSNDWDLFITLTFNPDKVDSTNYDEVTQKLSKWLNNQRRLSPNLKYIVVPEQHKSGRWHFHGLFANYDGKMVDSGKRTKDGKTIYNFGKYSLGFSTAVRVYDSDGVSRYIIKYITKDLCEISKNKKRYWCSRNLEHEEVTKMTLTDKQKKEIIGAVERHITFISESATPTNHIKYIELNCDDIKILRGIKGNVNSGNAYMDEIRYFFACSSKSKA